MRSAQAVASMLLLLGRQTALAFEARQFATTVTLESSVAVAQPVAQMLLRR